MNHTVELEPTIIDLAELLFDLFTKVVNLSKLFETITSNIFNRLE